MRALLPLLVIATGCSDNGGSTTSDAASCSCTALQVAFDKTSSMLGASNVQDAIDEVAARPIAEPPVGDRIKTIVQVFPNPGTMGGVEQTLACPDPRHDVALGGACGGGGTRAQLVETRINNDTNVASYTCGWSQPTGGSDAMRVTVVCLTQAR
jgi:hypothetical protein